MIATCKHCIQQKIFSDLQGEGNFRLDKGFRDNALCPQGGLKGRKQVIGTELGYAIQEKDQSAAKATPDERISKT